MIFSCWTCCGRDLEKSISKKASAFFNKMSQKVENMIFFFARKPRKCMGDIIWVKEDIFVRINYTTFKTA